MSWDLWVGERHVGNYTHNTNTMIRAASVYPASIEPAPDIFSEVILGAPVLGACWDDFDGAKASAVATWAEAIADELERHADVYESMNPGNGWGSREGLLDFIRRVVRACREDPDGVFAAHG